MRATDEYKLLTRLGVVSFFSNWDFALRWIEGKRFNKKNKGQTIVYLQYWKRSALCWGVL